jgi:hypothetical protein
LLISLISASGAILIISWLNSDGPSWELLKEVICFACTFSDSLWLLGPDPLRFGAAGITAYLECFPIPRHAPDKANTANLALASGGTLNK